MHQALIQWSFIENGVCTDGEKTTYHSRLQSLMDKGVDASVDSETNSGDSTDESDVSSVGSDGSWDSEDCVPLADL